MESRTTDDPGFRLADLDQRVVSELQEVDVTRSPLGPTIDFDESLDWLGLQHDHRDLVVRTFPSPDADPDRWWVLERMHAVLSNGMPSGDPEIPLPRFDHLGLVGMLFPLHLLVTVVPNIVRFHRERGVPTSVTRPTLDVAGELREDDRGRLTIDTSGWFLWRYRGLLYQVGVLRVIPVRLGEAPDSETYYKGADEHPRAPGHRRGDPALSLHIPAGTALDPRSVKSALDAMRPAFASWFAPDGPPRIGTCGSWLLDPQLREYLPWQSNIVQFQELFTLFDDGGDSDSIMPFVFPGHAHTAVADLPVDTTLQRSVVQHLQNNRRWRSCGGWVPLAE